MIETLLFCITALVVGLGGAIIVAGGINRAAFYISHLVIAILLKKNLGSEEVQKFIEENKL